MLISVARGIEGVQNVKTDLVVEAAPPKTAAKPQQNRRSKRRQNRAPGPGAALRRTGSTAAGYRALERIRL